MTTLVKTVVPTFIISGFDITEVYTQYYTGAFNELSLEQIAPIKTGIKASGVVNAATTNSAEPKYVVIDNRGIKSTLVATNTKAHSKCLWCRDSIIDMAVGLPVKKQHSLGELKFEVEGQYCCFECAYADFIRSFNKDPMFKNTECYLHYAFLQLYPNKQLIAAPDFRLHECNGGPLTKEQFHQKSNRYYDSGRLKLLPVSRHFIVR